MENTPENAKKKIRKLQDQMNSTLKDIKEFDEMLQNMEHPQGDIAIAGILSIQFGSTCEMLYAGMDERFKKFMPQYKEYVENFNKIYIVACVFSLLIRGEIVSLTAFGCS